ncbi:MAG TPA: DUF4188 domain-containing protein [Ktedonobacteraceae bacterium]|nr:DUF4188 domain-containing protein [Ktedonobacteraceae bacterium]
MAKILQGRFTAHMSAQMEEPFIVLILGIRINDFRLFWKWMPTAFYSLPMLYTLIRHRAAGFLGGQATYFWPGIGLIQYWRTFEDLERFARSKEYPHFAAWRWYNKAIGNGGSVGLWHEVFLVKPLAHEVVYENMPPFGLVAATKPLPVEKCTNTITRLHLGEKDASARVLEEATNHLVSNP